MNKLLLTAAVGAVALLGFNTVSKNSEISLGIRNHNPGNIELGQPWAGLADVQRHKRFATFVHPLFGIRAMNRIIRTYINRAGGVITVEQVINTWAPPSENETENYVRFVAGQLGVTPQQVVHEGLMRGMIAAMMKMESGPNNYSDELIDAAIVLGGKSLPSDINPGPIVALVEGIERGERQLADLRTQLLLVA